MVSKPWQHHAKVVISRTSWIRVMSLFRFMMIYFTLSIVSSTITAGAVELRPNDPVYVKMGEKLYLEQCASCHGVNLEGQVGWQDTMFDGMRLASPHDKSGHTWHHPDEMLFNLIKNFLDKVTADKIVIDESVSTIINQVTNNPDMLDKFTTDSS